LCPLAVGRPLRLERALEVVESLSGLCPSVCLWRQRMEIVGEPTVTDVVLARDPYGEHDEKSRRQIVWFDSPLTIVPEVTIEPVETEFSRAIMDACEPRGEEFRPVRQWGSPYGFFRRPTGAPANEGLSLDPDSLLYVCIALSRLVYPTAIGFEYAARTREWSNGARQIVPNSDNRTNPYAFVQHTNEKWLNPSDVPAMSRLARSYLDSPPPTRVKTGLWHYESAAHSYYLDTRWLELTIALEGLVHIHDEKIATERGKQRWVGSTECFVKRLSGLGNIDATLRMSEDDLRKIYDMRSLVAHGGLPGMDPATSALYEKLDDFARAVLRKAVEEPTFAATFATQASIQTALPIT
jgi:hypothetical protein